MNFFKKVSKNCQKNSNQFIQLLIYRGLPSEKPTRRKEGIGNKKKTKINLNLGSFYLKRVFISVEYF